MQQSITELDPRHHARDPPRTKRTKWEHEKCKVVNTRSSAVVLSRPGTTFFERRIAMLRFGRLIGLSVLMAIAAVVGIRSHNGASSREWRYFGADHAFTRYSALDQINRDNVKNLRIVWRRPA